MWPALGTPTAVDWCSRQSPTGSGTPLYGHELSGDISPLMAGLAWTVKFDKQRILWEICTSEPKRKGLSHQVIHFTLQENGLHAKERPCARPMVKQWVRSCLAPIPRLRMPHWQCSNCRRCPTRRTSCGLRKHSTPLKIQKAPLYS